MSMAWGKTEKYEVKSNFKTLLFTGVVLGLVVAFAYVFAH
jgi:hypothetical protein